MHAKYRSDAPRWISVTLQHYSLNFDTAEDESCFGYNPISHSRKETLEEVIELLEGVIGFQGDLSTLLQPVVPVVVDGVILSTINTIATSILP